MQGIRRREHANHKASSLFRKHALCSGRDGHDAAVYYDPQHPKKAVDNAVWLTKKRMMELEIHPGNVFRPRSDRTTYNEKAGVPKGVLFFR